MEGDTKMSERPRSKHFIRAIAAMGIAAVVAAVVPSMPVDAAERERSSEPWIVQVAGELPDRSMQSCTGVVVATGWVLTARHCKSDTIYFGNFTYFGNWGKSSPLAVLQEHLLAPADLKLLKVNPVLAWRANYPVLASKFDYHSGVVARSYGLTKEAPIARVDVERVDMKVDLRVMEGNANGTSLSSSIRATTRGVGVAAGTSGAALVIGKQIVGIGNKTVELRDSTVEARYADIASVRSQIRKTIAPQELPNNAQAADPAPAVMTAMVDTDGRLRVQLSTPLVNSILPLFFWLNGKRIFGSTKKTPSAAGDSPQNTSSIVLDLDSPLHPNDVLQVRLANSLMRGLDQGQLIYENTIEGASRIPRKKSAEPVVIKAHLIDGRLAVSLDSTYVRLGLRTVFWLNKKYVGEVYGNQAAYVAVVPPIRGVSTYRFAQATTANDVLEVGVVSGAPGDAPGRPEQSRLIYSAGAPGSSS